MNIYDNKEEKKNLISTIETAEQPEINQMASGIAEVLDTANQELKLFGSVKIEVSNDGKEWVNIGTAESIPKVKDNIQTFEMCKINQENFNKFVKGKLEPPIESGEVRNE